MCSTKHRALLTTNTNANANARKRAGAGRAAAGAARAAADVDATRQNRARAPRLAGRRAVAGRQRGRGDDAARRLYACVCVCVPTL
jgi:hypothetical protein